MSDDIKELAAGLCRRADRMEREWGHKTQHTVTLHHTANALMVMVDKVEELVKERDRLKAAVKEIADMLNRGPDSSQNWDVKSIYDIARKALEAKE
jgi:hypothetical protein